MQVESRSTSFLVIAFILSIAAAWSCSEVSDAPANFSENRLRARIALSWSHCATGDFEAYTSMWSERNQQDFRTSEQDRQNNFRMWKSILQLKPAFELLDLKISDQRAKAKVRTFILEKDGSRSSDIEYDHWVFENGDWFLDDAGRTE